LASPPKLADATQHPATGGFNGGCPIAYILLHTVCRTLQDQEFGGGPGSPGLGTSLGQLAKLELCLSPWNQQSMLLSSVALMNRARSSRVYRELVVMQGACSCSLRRATDDICTRLLCTRTCVCTCTADAGRPGRFSTPKPQPRRPMGHGPWAMGHERHPCRSD
jgi:hypothetical protein